MKEYRLVIGGIYRHFKGNHYRVDNVAIHSETSEEYVVYTSLKDYKTYIRLKDMFLSEVDHAKYPSVTQKYRFEYLEDAGVY